MLPSIESIVTEMMSGDTNDNKSSNPSRTNPVIISALNPFVKFRNDLRFLLFTKLYLSDPAASRVRPAAPSATPGGAGAPQKSGLEKKRAIGNNIHGSRS